MTAFEFVRRRHDASILGQFCPAQAALTTGIGSLSAFASAFGTLASTGGAKLGRIVTAAAMKAAIVTAERALIMIVPCGPGLAGRLAEMTPVDPERFMGPEKYNRDQRPDFMEPVALAAVAGPG
jgi:DNA-binding transcriptional regulator of glucitol operon